MVKKLDNLIHDLGINTGPDSVTAVGICVKKIDQTVNFQNENCLKVCGNQNGKICDFGCIKILNRKNSEILNSPGMDLLPRSTIKGELCDVVVINDGQNLFSILLNLKDKIKIDFDYFKDFDFTQRELEVIKLRLEGKSNSEVCEILFIAKSTLKTHLNHIYQKLPSNIRLWKKA